MGTFGKKDSEVITGDGKHVIRTFRLTITCAGGGTIDAQVLGEDASSPTGDNCYNFATGISKVSGISKSDDGTYFALDADGKRLTIKNAALVADVVALLGVNMWCGPDNEVYCNLNSSGLIHVYVGDSTSVVDLTAHTTGVLGYITYLSAS